jgi:hypothetical protein
MKDLKEGIQGSVFPVKLLMAYVISVSLDHLIFTIQISDPDYIGRWVDVWNWTLGWGLILCVPLLGVILSAIWYFRRMPIFAVVMILVALWPMGTALWFYFITGFDPRFDLNMQPLNFLRGSIVFAIPFVVVYLAWRFWQRRKRVIG